MTLSSTERRELASQMEKARDLRVVQLNPTMRSDSTARAAKTIVDLATSSSRSRTVLIIAVIR